MRSSKRRSVKPSARLIVTGISALLALGLLAPIEQAAAEPTPGSHSFCSSVWLQPFGQAGDRCAAGHAEWGHIGSVAIQTGERAGCVNYEGWYGELYRSWWCLPKGAGGSITVPQDGGSYDGIIRNNNLSFAGRFSGSYWCCWSY